MDCEGLAELVRQPEGQLLEFKREWFDLSSPREKARLARVVCAMANGLAEGQRGYVVIGREDPDRGGEVVGVDDPPTPEQVTEILSRHLGPAPDVTVYPRIKCGGKQLSVIEVRWSVYHPHYSTRDVDSVLSTDQVLVRSGATTRNLKPSELELMIRAKDARIGTPSTDGPLIVGFVDLPTRAGSSASIRIRNVSGEPIEGISAVVDIERVFPPGFVHRMRLLGGLTLRPDETRELTVRPSQADFYTFDGQPLDDSGKIWSHWLNLVLHLTYRDQHGIIQSVVLRAALG